MFTDSYGEQSCTAGRSSFITGQSVLRTGLSKVGIPGGADRHEREDHHDRGARSRTRATPPGSSARTISAISTTCCRPITASTSSSATSITSTPRKSRRCTTIYPEKDFPELPQELRAARRHPFLGDRQGRPDREAALGQGRQAEDRGHRPAEHEAHGDLRRRIRRRGQGLHQARRTKPASRSSCGSTPRTCTSFTHTKKESLGQAGRWQSPYHDTMIDHDKNVGEMLDLLDELGIADDTFVMYSTDNGPHRNSWPDGGMTPFRSEKNTNWEGAFRVPLLVRWPGKIKAGSDLERDRPAPRLVADLPGDGGRARRRREAEEGLQGDRPHLQEPHRRLQPAALPDRRGRRRARASCFVYISDDGDMLGAALRQLEDRVHGAALPRHACRSGPSRSRGCGLPKLFNLRTDPYEFADITSNTYYDWFIHHAYFIYGGDDGRAEVRGDVQGLPDDPEAEHLHHRRCDPDDEKHQRG